MQEFLEIGQIVNTFGIKGMVKVKPFTDDITRFDNLKKVYVESNKTKKQYEIEEVKYHKDMVLIKFKGIDKVEDAELLRNSYLKVNRQDEPELEEGTYYIVDLIGLDVYSDEGKLLGKLDDVFNSGSCDIYVVKDELGKQLLLPAISDVIKEINLNESIIGRAKEKGLINVNLINIRDFSKNKHKKVDDTPYGGGAGMVIQPDVVYDAYKSVIKNNDKSGLDEKSKKTKVIYMSPQGKKLDQQKVEELSKQEHLILLCGHYEGIDQRVLDTIVDEEISIGDYVLTGGELPAMVLIDSVSRYVEGVLKDGSTTEESFSQGLLEYPQYTRPEVFEEQQVPEVLRSGNHQMIDKWRREQSLKRTLEKRPDLLEKVDLSDEDKKILEKIKNDVPNKVGTAQIKEGGKF